MVAITNYVYSNKLKGDVLLRDGNSMSPFLWGDKMNIEIAKEVFSARGYVLLSEKWSKANEKLQYKCPLGHIGEINFYHFKGGAGCPGCWSIRRCEIRKTPIEEIRKLFLEDGYVLLNKVYDAKKKLEATCTRGHLYKTTLAKWKIGYRCAACAAINNSGSNNYNWNPDREAVKQNRKIWTAWRNTIRSGIGYNGTTEEVKNILGYDWTDLREHIKSAPNWNQCKENYHIDHIFPVKAFLDYGIDDPKIVNALENLRPLPTIENLRKNKFYNKEEFEKYLQKKGIKWHMNQKMYKS